MAKMQAKLPEDFLQKVSRLGNQTDEILPKALEVGGEVVLNKVKDNLQSVIGSGTKYPSKTTGELQRTLGLSKAMIDKNGNHNVKIGFAEPRSNGVSNAKIASVIEYGKHGQPAKPFLAPAKSASRRACVDAIVTKLEEEIGKI